MGKKRWCKVCTSKENLYLTGINWDRPKQGNIRQRLMISGSGWMSCTSPDLPFLQRTRFACSPQQQQGQMICNKFAFRKKRSQGWKVFVASAKVKSQVISFGQLPQRSTQALVIENGRGAAQCWTTNLDQLGNWRRPKQDLAFFKIILKTDLLQLMRQIPENPHNLSRTKLFQCYVLLLKIT